MARFYANVQGNRGEATRMGTPQSGLQAHVRGWDVGVRVHAVAQGDSDVFNVWATTGSNGTAPDQLIATVRRGPNGELEVAK